MIPASRRKTSNQKKLILGVIAGIVAIVCVIVIILLMTIGTSSDGTSDDESAQMQTVGEQETTDKIESSIKYPSTDESSDKELKEKQYYIDFVDLAVLENGGGIFDIHIRFPNGEDYVVVSCVEISDIREEGFFTSLDDKENYMLSSAKTDMDVYTGTLLYLARYEVAMSEATPTDYPWNLFVLGAHGVHDSDKESAYAKRIQLEENLVKFMNQTLSR